MRDIVVYLVLSSAILLGVALLTAAHGAWDVAGVSGGLSGLYLLVAYGIAQNRPESDRTKAAEVGHEQ